MPHTALWCASPGTQRAQREVAPKNPLSSSSTQKPQVTARFSSSEISRLNNGLFKLLYIMRAAATIHHAIHMHIHMHMHDHHSAHSTAPHLATRRACAVCWLQFTGTSQVYEVHQELSNETLVEPSTALELPKQRRGVVVLAS